MATGDFLIHCDGCEETVCIIGPHVYGSTPEDDDEDNDSEEADTPLFVEPQQG